jgi:hypothetical protein
VREKDAAVISLLDLVTERAIELLKELQVEYRIQPLLEEDNAFSQDQVTARSGFISAHCVLLVSVMLLPVMLM